MAHEMAIKGTHGIVLRALSDHIGFHKEDSILDIGAGQGALSAKLKNAGLSVSACDLETDQFSVAGIECKQCDNIGSLPYPDAQFDFAVAVEVLEHIDGHQRFFFEAARILKPNGTLLFTTPNILSLKSRIKFLLTGCFYSFPLLTPFTKNPIHQHISPFTLNRYAWMLSQHLFTISHVLTDKMQKSSWMLSFFVPFIWISTFALNKKDDGFKQQNSNVALFGRKLVIIAKKMGSHSQGP